VLADKYGGALSQQSDHFERLPFDLRSAAPECFENEPTHKSDVFSFGTILCELLTGQPGFPLDLSSAQVMKMIIVAKKRQNIPDFVGWEVRELITDCWKHKPHKRPSFEDILMRLDEMDFKFTAGVDSARVRRFVRAVTARESAHGIEIEESK
jgi:serine/threonine protein kinase